MAEIASAYVTLIPSLRGGGAEISKQLGGVGGEAGKAAGKSFGGAFGLVAGALGAVGIGSFFSNAISGAGDLEQSMGAVSSVFKGSAGQMNEWSKSAATDVGLSANEFNELGTLIGAQLKNGGTAMDELAPKTNDLIKTGADLASMFGGTTSEAVSALSSALKGERDPIERYGVSLNQAKIDAEAASLGFSKVGGTLSAEANQAATLSLIMKQTADAHGNFGRETDTLAHKQQVLNAQLANGKARIGTELLPAVAALTGALSAALGPAINIAVAGIHNVVAAGSGLYNLLVKGDFTGALREAFNVEEDSPVVGALFKVRDTAITVIGGFRAMFAAYKAGDGDITSSGFAGFMERIGGGFREITGGVRAFFAAFKAGDGDITSSGFAGFLEGLGLQARTLFDAIGPSVSALLPQILSLWSAFSPLQIIFKAIEPLLPQIVGMFGQLASVVGGTLSSVLTTLLPMFMQLSGVISQSLGTVLAAVLPVAVQLITMLGSTISELLPIIMPIIGTVIELATTLISQLAPIFMQLVTAVLPMVVSILGAVFQAIGPVIQIVAGMLIPIIQALMPVIVTVFGVVVSIITAAMQIVMGIIQVVTGLISGNWGQVWEGIVNIFSGVWNAIVALIGGAIQILWSVIVAGLTLVSGFIGGVLGGIGQFFIDTWNNITKGISDFIGGVGKFFEGLPDAIMGALSGAGTWLFDAGKNIVEGLFNGIKSLAGTIGNFFLSLLPGWIVEPFKVALGIHSPSRVFKGLGQNIGMGLLDGVEGMQGKIDGTMSGLVTVPDVTGLKSTLRKVSAIHAGVNIPRAPAYAGASPGAMGSDAGGGPLVVQNVHPAPGMSEGTIARVSAESMNAELRRLRG